jgi:hypothetical protein
VSRPDQLPLWGREAAARQARDEGIARAAQGATSTWARIAWDVLVAYLRTHPTMHSDDLWNAGLPATRENRALGPLIMRARRRGLIRPSGQVLTSVRAHAQPHIVWQSLIYQGDRHES